GGQHSAMHVLIVAAPLGAGKQVWFEPDVPFVDALVTALSIPGPYPPVEPTSGWIREKPGEDEFGRTKQAKRKGAKTKAATKESKYDRRLVDGALVRQNPLPALFRWLRANPGKVDLNGKDPEDTRVHLVYNVPIGPDQSSSLAKLREQV